MNPDKQRIAIAEACRWKYRNPAPEGVMWPGWACWRRPDGCFFMEAPDYIHDLNAMHEAEKAIKSDADTCFRYRQTLMAVCAARYGQPCDEKSCAWWLWHATADEKAEAFLRTFGKWEDEA